MFARTTSARGARGRAAAVRGFAVAAALVGSPLARAADASARYDYSAYDTLAYAQLTYALHPVRTQPIADWQRATAAVMAGPGASTFYRDVAAEMDVRWRLEAAGTTLEPFDEADEMRVLNLSLTGAGIGLQRVLEATVSRSPELRVVHTIARSVASPSLSVQKRDSGMKVDVDRGTRMAGPAMADASELPCPYRAPPSPADARRAPRGPPRPPPPTVRVGTGFDLGETDEETATINPAVSGDLEARNAGVDTLRLESSVTRAPDAAISPVETWAIVARQDVLPRVSLHADLRSAAFQALPTRALAGLSWSPRSDERWYTRVNVIRAFPAPVERLVNGEWRVEVQLRANVGWRLPQDVNRWPLGLEPGARGVVLPSIPDRGPNRAPPLAQADSDSGS